MRIAKSLAALAIIVIAILVVANFSAVETRFECSGALTQGEVAKDSLIYIKLDEYRWWVGFWSDSDGALWLEVPGQTLDYFETLHEVGDQLQIFGPNREIGGHFSTLSRWLALKNTLGFFDGQCKAVDIAQR